MVRAFGADPSATSRCATDGCYPVRERDGKQLKAPSSPGVAREGAVERYEAGEEI
jgi:hypothetical protein